MSGPDAPNRFTVDFTGLTLLGQFRVDEKLAEGGMGSVYRATDLNLGRTVAVKVPHPRFLGDAGFRGRFAAEMEELVRLEHPGIVRILARGEQDQVPFFVLQYLGGGSLEDRIARGTESPAEAVPWLRSVAGTLDYVHGRGIVHRDVKPANILFDGAGHVFLSDFGVAKALESEDRGLTAPGAGIGSPKYMAPEQGTGDEVGPAADQYGLASVLYEALTGEPPFGTGDPIRILVRKQQEEPPALSEKLPAIGRPISDAVARALSRDPADRFATCREFAEAFAEGLSTGSLAAVARAGAGPGRRSRLAAAAGILVLLVAAGAGYALLRPGRGPEPRPAGDGEGATRTFVDLLDAGADPRRVLRYQVAAGAREHMRMIWLVSSTSRIGGEEQSSPGEIPICFDSDVVVNRLEPGGNIAYEWTITDCQACETEDPKAKAIAAGLAEPLRGLKGLRAAGRIDSRGLGHELDFLEAEDQIATARQFTKGVAEGLRTLCVPLPEEAVGVGARWDVTETMEVGGMRFTGTTRYHLFSLEGYRAEIRFSAAMVALGQKDAPFFVQGMGELDASRHNARSEGVARVDFTQLVPVSSEVEYDLEIEGTLRKDDSAIPFLMRNAVKTTMERR